MSIVMVAFGLTLLAGLCTGIGSLIAFFAHRTNTKFLSVALGFSAGVMVYVSFMEILPEAQDLMLKSHGIYGTWLALLAFFLGMGIIAMIDRLVPSFENPHEIHKVEQMVYGDKEEYFSSEDAGSFTKKYQKLLMCGVCAAIAVAIHNFPEGIATFMSAIKDTKLGIIVALAIAIHNIPEGIAVSVPIFYATASRKKAFFYSFLSGLSEPLGAVIAYFFLAAYMSDFLLGVVFACVAGIMVFISFDQLLPTAREYGEHHLSIYGLILGMAVMAISLILL